MLNKDLLNIDITEAIPAKSSLIINPVGRVNVRTATIGDEAILKSWFGDKLEKLQVAMNKGEMNEITKAFWLLLDKKSKDKFREIKLQDSNDEIVDINFLENEHEIFWFLSLTPNEKMLISHSIIKSLAGEEVIKAEVPDEDLKKKILTQLKYIE